MFARAPSRSTYAMAVLLMALLFYFLYAKPQDSDPVGESGEQNNKPTDVQFNEVVTQANRQGFTPQSAPVRVPRPPANVSTSAEQQITVDILTDPRFTESALAQDDDHYSLPDFMKKPLDLNRAFKREQISQFLEKTDAQEDDLQKKIEMATIKADSQEVVTHLQLQLHQLRKKREAVILNNIGILDGDFFYD